MVEQAAFDAWVDLYSSDLLRVCFLSLRDEGLAQDALQDTFLKAWLSRARFEGRNGCSEKTWLMRIAINTCKNYRRSAWVRRAVLTEPEQGAEDPDTALYLDVMNLPDKLRLVVVLHYYQRISLPEVAQILSINKSTAYHRLQKALQLLRCPMEGGESYDA